MHINELDCYEIPKIKLTQSINNSISTVIFIFSTSKILSLFQTKKLEHLTINLEKFWISSDTIHLKFKNGKPTQLLFIFVLKNAAENKNFSQFLELYAKKNQLNFIKK